MGNLSNFNPREHEMPTRSQMLGTFRFGIVDAEIETLDWCKRLKIELQVVSPGDHNGRKQYDRIQLSEFGSEKAEKYHKAKLSQLLFAAGIPDADDTSELVGRTITAKLGKQRQWNKETKTSSYSDEWSEVTEYIVPDDSAPPEEPEQPITSIPDDLF